MAGSSEEAKIAYLQSMVEAATREELLIMLLDGAVKFMGYAEMAFNEEKWDEVHNRLCRVQNIFMELGLSLESEGGEITFLLADIYGFIQGLLIQANVDRDREAFDQAKRLVSEIRQMWVETIEKARGDDSRGGEGDEKMKEEKPAPKSINISG